MFCPKCGSEYQPEIRSCPMCACELSETPPETEEKKYLRLKELVQSGRAVLIAKAGIRDASRMAESLQASGVAAILTGDSCGGGCGNHRYMCSKEVFDIICEERKRILRFEILRSLGKQFSKLK